MSVSLLLALQVFSASAAEGRQASGEELVVRSASGCPRLFGEARAHEANAARRTRHLHDVRITDERVEIVHSMGRWAEPKPLRMKGLELVAVEKPEVDADHPASPDERVAVVEVGDALADLCSPGVYALTVDDALGASAQVLAIDDRGVLVESGGRLAFLPWAGHPLPRDVRMIWRSSYDVVVDATAAKSGAVKDTRKPKAASAKARERPAKKRPKPRKKR